MSKYVIHDAVPIDYQPSTDLITLIAPNLSRPAQKRLDELARTEILVTAAFSPVVGWPGWTHRLSLTSKHDSYILSDDDEHFVGSDFLVNADEVTTAEIDPETPDGAGITGLGAENSEAHL